MWFYGCPFLRHIAPARLFQAPMLTLLSSHRVYSFLIRKRCTWLSLTSLFPYSPNVLSTLAEQETHIGDFHKWLQVTQIILGSYWNTIRYTARSDGLKGDFSTESISMDNNRHTLFWQTMEESWPLTLQLSSCISGISHIAAA